MKLTRAEGLRLIETYCCDREPEDGALDRLLAHRFRHGDPRAHHWPYELQDEVDAVLYPDWAATA